MLTRLNMAVYFNKPIKHVEEEGKHEEVNGVCTKL